MLLALWITWSPLLGRTEPVEIWSAPPANAREVFGNFLLFMPLGAALVTLLSGPAVRRLAWVGLLGLGLSAAIEIGQGFMANRILSPWDLLINAVGAMAGGGIMVALGPKAPRLLRAVMVVLALAVAVHMVVASALVSRAAMLSGWDDSFGVVGGDELGGGRPFIGEVGEARVCAGTADDRVCVDPSAPEDARRELVVRALASQRVQLQAELVSRAPVQRGPARIITFSASTTERNATLGQADDDLVLRLRSVLQGPNGVVVSYFLNDAIVEGVLTRVKAEYDRGRVELSARSGERRRDGGFYPGLLQAWLLADYVYRPGIVSWMPRSGLRELPIERTWIPLAVAAVVLWLPAGAWLSSAVHGPSGILSGAFVPMALTALADMSLASPPPEALLPSAAAAAAAGLLGALISRHGVTGGSSRTRSLSLKGAA